MPCEGCNVQFTVFKRKRICNECKRYYCNQCLVKRNNSILCERCIVFTTRPISKVDLLKLKPKDLIFYLQSKHISTAGCVEKEELVNLILAHVNSDAGQIPNNNNTYGYTEQSSADNSEHCSNPLDQLKQTCQNLFSSFTDKIAADFHFDSKNSATNTNTQSNISDQPRFSTREIPTYASALHSNDHNVASATTTNSETITQRSVPTINIGAHPVEQVNIGSRSSSSISSPSSPIISISSFSSQSISSQSQAGRVGSEDVLSSKNEENVVSGDNVSRNTSASNRLLDSVIVDCSGSGCECSDEEIMTKFQSSHPLGRKQCLQDGEKSSPVSDSTFEDRVVGPNISAAATQCSSKSSGGENKNSEDSSGSSFEELGAVGGGTPSDTEHWQFINKTEASPFMESEMIGDTPSGATISSDTSGSQTFQSHSNGLNTLNESIGALPRRLIRRRSDGIIYTQRGTGNGTAIFPQVDEESDDENIEQNLRKRQRKSCNKCGKTKKNLKEYVAKFKQQLESSDMTEGEIKQELNAFLTFLESRARSFDHSDSESNIDVGANSSSNEIAADKKRPVNRSDSIVLQTSYGRDDDGIHVYGHEGSSTENLRHVSRFINLSDFQSSSELDELSVKQLKEILMLNRVDYKGCCEKHELLERVHRLWNDLQTSPAVDKLPVDDLCKICMDAPIECVILECGHMATCTQCGKVLSECPICRQYIVRVVRFFRA